MLKKSLEAHSIWKKFACGAVVYTLNIQKIACDSNSDAKYEKIACGTELSIV